MHAVPVAMAAAARAHGVAFRYRTTVAKLDVTGGRACGVITDRRRAHPGRRRGRERRPADGVRRTCCRPARRRAGCSGCATPPRPSSCTPARRRPFRTPRTTPSTSGTAWDETFEEIIDRGRPMSDPSFLLTTPTKTDPALAPAEPAHPLRAVPGAEPARPGRLGDGARRATATTSSRRWRSAATPASATTSRPSTSSPRPTGARRVWPPARRSPPRTRSRRPARSARRPWTGASTGSSSAGRTPSPASACRWC